jgi:hypothetical protein
MLVVNLINKFKKGDELFGFFSSKWVGITLGCLTLLMAAGLVYAFVQEYGKVSGTTFRVSSDPVVEGGVPIAGNQSLKLLQSLTGSTTANNLADQVPGPIFQNINTAWKGKALLKVYNSGTKTLKLISSAEYNSDPNTLRDDIFVKVSEWDDKNNNGKFEDNEIGDSYGYNSVLRMKNDTFNLGNLSAGDVKGFVMEFDGTGLSETNASQEAIYDFIINGEEI